MIYPTAYRSRELWLAARRIGASDVAAILGIAGRERDQPHRSAWDVWSRLTGGDEHTHVTDAMRRGTAWEPLVLGAYQGETGRTVERMEHSLYRHPVHEWATASPDALVLDGDTGETLGAVEAKTDGSPARSVWGESQQIERWSEHTATVIRPDYALQCYYQAWVCGFPWVDLAVLLPWYELRIYRVHRDPEVAAALEDQLGAWHRRHVVEREPPPIDGSDACVDWLRDRFRGGAGPRQATDHEATQIRRYAALRATITEAEKEAKELKGHLIAAAGDADCIAIGEVSKGSPRLTISRQAGRVGAYDVDRIAHEYRIGDVESYRKPAGPPIVKLLPYNLESP